MKITESVVNIRTGEVTEREIELDIDTPAVALTKTQQAAQAEANDTTIQQRLDAALDYNRQVIAQGNAWVQNNPGTLSAAVLSNQVRALTNVAVKAAEQRVGIIRALRRKFDGTD